MPDIGESRAYQSTQQFLVLHPQVVAPQIGQIKYEDPIIAPITQLGHISTAKEQLYFFYPSSPLHQAPLVSFQRDDGEDFNLINFISNWFASKPAETVVPAEAAPVAQAPAPVAQAPITAPATAPVAAPEQNKPLEETPSFSVGEEQRPGLFVDQLSGLDVPAAAPAQKPQRIEINPDAEFIPQQKPPTVQQPQQPQPQPPRPQYPAPQPAYAPFPLVPQLPDRRVYIVSGQPQFFGNFDAFANPLNPIFSLQPLTAIIPRSKEDPESEAITAAEQETAPAPADWNISHEAVPEDREETFKNADEEKPQVDVVARSNSRIELIPSEQGDVVPTEKKLSDVERRIVASIQDKSAVEGEYCNFYT